MNNTETKSITNNGIIISNYEMILITTRNYCKRYSVPYDMWDDVLQEIIIIMLEYDHEKLLEISNEHRINAFISGILRNQLFSKTSAIYRKLRRFKDKSCQLTDEQYTHTEC